MDYQYQKRKTGKDKERRNREINGKYSAKHIRIQEQCQENHFKNIQDKKTTKLDDVIIDVKLTKKKINKHKKSY
jgi:hypothetical protein|tara:strand:+ start:619 stop:840 length:222 start_codon:yes stop_codon:yes gene_type:complete